jgi:hypothetical protein
MNANDYGGIGIISGGGGGSPLSSIAGRRTRSLSPDGDCFVRGRMAAFSLESHHPSFSLSMMHNNNNTGGGSSSSSSAGYDDNDANKAVERPECRESNVRWMLDALESSNVRFDVGWEDRYEDWYMFGEMTSYRRVYVDQKPMVIKFVEDSTLSCCLLFYEGRMPRAIYSRDEFWERMATFENRKNGGANNNKNMSGREGEELYSSMDTLIDISDVPTTTTTPIGVVPDLLIQHHHHTPSLLVVLPEGGGAEFDQGEEASAIGAALSHCLSMG